MKNSLDILSQGFSLAPLTPAQREALAHLPPHIAEAFVRETYRHVKNSPLASSLLPLLYQRCSVGGFSIEFLMEEILAVYQWLAARSLSAKLLDVVEYCACAQEGSNSAGACRVEWFLEQFGFLRSYPCAS